MIARSFLLALVVSGLSAGAALADAPKKCTLGKVFELPVTMSPGIRPLVPVRINGQDVQLLVDSGAFYSFITEPAAQRLKLHRRMAPINVEVRGTTGPVKFDIGDADSLEMDGVKLGRATFLVGTNAGEGDSSGILGQNILNALDVEYDFANGAVRLFKPLNCHNENPAYWAGDKPIAELDLARLDESQGALRGEGWINGQRVRLTFDTGAARSVLKLGAARRLGFDPNGPDVRQAGISVGAGSGAVDTWIAPFKSLNFGGEQIFNIQIQVADIELKTSDMLLGADFFLSHRVYVSRAQHKLFFTYNGGPVFKLDRPFTPGSAQTAANAAAAPTAAPGADEPADAAAYGRRADAFLARRDFGRAIADLTRAIALAPKDPKYLYDRATAHIAAREPLLAMADLDAELKLNPSDSRALLMRGELFLGSRDQARAEADFDAAVKAAPAGSRTPLGVAVAYQRAAQFDRAIALYDRWIAEHPRDEQMGAILESRCWARALTGKELPAALADCDLALRKGPQIAAMYNSRGMVLLRLARYDDAIADYDRALKLQPKMPWALLGRGYARHAKGLKAEGDADVAAAAALAPNLPKAAAGFGIKDGGGAAGA